MVSVYICSAMNLHEYQGKEILKRYGVRVQDGYVACTPQEAREMAERLRVERGVSTFVVKAQVHAGGRGKAGGIRVAHSPEEVEQIAGSLLGRRLVTHQTGPEGKPVNAVFVCEDVYGGEGPYRERELYVGFLLDRQRETHVCVHSPEGGVDIEEVARQKPERVFKEWVHPLVGLMPFQARRIAKNLGAEGELMGKLAATIYNLWRAYSENDAYLLEVNPLLLTRAGEFVVVDTKFQVEDNALMRRPELAQMRDPTQEDPAEVEASRYGLSFVKLGGNVGCMVNGAGLAMATMDMIKYYGGEPANFLDVGGRATPETVEAGFRIILQDERVKVILVNIFGGIVRCDRVAQGIVEAVSKLGDVRVPVVVRLQGTNAELARQIIEGSGMRVYYATELDEAARKVMELLGQN